MKFLCTLAIAALPLLVNSHVTVSPNQGVEGTYASTSIRIPHGCDKSDTVKVIIEFDQDVLDLKTEFSAGIVAGWKAEIKIKPKAEEKKPKGQTIAVVYSDGKIPYNMFADFPLSFKLPSLSALPKEKNNTFYFKASQLCENNQWLNWTDPKDPKYPPASFKLLSKDEATKGSSGKDGAKGSSSTTLVSSQFLLLISSLYFLL
ncbi:hypothetical protein K502DRAFT_295013 [Neoconidiobolus thromboides FSU 785]|nr:hypothetical protein K502DRAFT_295013 [Neoconidiobolus thromboides FSU 785]